MGCPKLLKIVFLREIPDSGSRWLERVLAAEDLCALRAAFDSGEARIGRAAWVPSAESKRVLEDNLLGWTFALPSHCGEIARMLILKRACEIPRGTAAVETWYESTDDPGRRAILRALPLVPRPKRFLDVAVLAVLSPNARLFDAICFDNPYPARYFDEETYNHMVERALFMDRPLERVIGLRSRRGAPLSRVANGYADSRRAGGRSLPDDFGILTEE